MNVAEQAMPTAGPVLEQCYVCIMSSSDDPHTSAMSLDEIEAQHRAYLVDLEERGVLFGAGPYVDFDGWGDGHDVGMMVIRADRQDAAEAVAFAEPFTREGIRSMRVIPWQRNGGTVYVSIRFANRELEVDGQSYRLGSEAPSNWVDGPGGGVVYACLMQTNPSPPPHGRTLEELRSAHQEFLKSLERSGALLASGPLRDAVRRADDVGTGLIMLRAESRDAAERLIGEEPYAKSGARIATVAPWARVMGSTSVGARLGAGELRVDARAFGLLP